MNLFYLSEDLEENARFHVDKHMKMCLEAAQLMCGVCLIHGVQAPYRLAYRNHPLSIWARANRNNFLFVGKYGLAIAKEYTYRYNRRHAAQDVLEYCVANVPQALLDKPMDPPTQCFDIKYHNSNPIIGHRENYKNSKKHLFRWTNREIPYWIENFK